VLVNTCKFPRRDPTRLFRHGHVGGQYVAAALAGMLASYAVSTPLTRKPVSGFNGVNDFRSRQDKNDDAASGLLVVEQKGLAVLGPSLHHGRHRAPRRSRNYRWCAPSTT
jgi:hypothetical protein